MATDAGCPPRNARRALGQVRPRGRPTAPEFAPARARGAVQRLASDPREPDKAACSQERSSQQSQAPHRASVLLHSLVRSHACERQWRSSDPLRLRHTCSSPQALRPNSPVHDTREIQSDLLVAKGGARSELPPASRPSPVAGSNRSLQRAHRHGSSVPCEVCHGHARTPPAGSLAPYPGVVALFYSIRDDSRFSAAFKSASGCFGYPVTPPLIGRLPTPMPAAHLPSQSDPGAVSFPLSQRVFAK